MKTCSQTIKQCDPRLNARKVASFNGVSHTTVYRAFNDDNKRFAGYVIHAMEQYNYARLERAKAILLERE